MKNRYLWLGILVMALVFGMTVVGCEDDSTDIQTVQYEGKDVTGNTYILTVTEKADRAAYTPVEGDSYVLIIKITGQPDKESNGTVKGISTDGTFTLQPSVEGSATFSIVISGEKISSVTGDIAVEGGETITPRSFGTIYLRAYRWTNNTDNIGATGELWSQALFLSDFYPDTLKPDTIYKVKISGTATQKIDHVTFQFQRVIDGGWWWIGEASIPGELSGSFDDSFNLRVDVTSQLINEDGEIVVNFVKQLWQKRPDGSYLFNYENPLPEDIPNGTIMAAISNFSISLVE